jgi:diadenosine tetraphosphate (Ap4A) HIT family hydrolase
VKGCPFCPPAADREALLVTEHAVALRPQEGSGGLVVPRAHRTSPFDLTPEEWSDTRGLLRELRRVLEADVPPDGWNVGWNIGRVAGQEVDHVHCHLIPRYADEPYAGRGIRWWFKQPENRRPS